MAERIPFMPQQGTGLDELAGAGREAMNVSIDATGSVRRRPGLQLWSSAGVIDADGLDGMYATVSGDVYALSASAPGPRQLYRITSTGSVPLPGVDLVGTLRPVFAETESILVMSAGNHPNKLVFATDTTSQLVGAPNASHLVANSSRLVANDMAGDRTKVYWSGQALGTSFAGFEDWTSGFPTTGFFTAESRPDPVLAILETTNELFIFGTTTVQVWGPDANRVYIPLATREQGLGATHSIIRTEQSCAYLDHRRRFVIGDGRAVEVISDPIQRTLDEMAVVSDCYGFRVSLGSVDALVWTFPSSQQTFVFQRGAGWGQWSGWDDTTNNYAPFPALAVTHNPVTNETLAGLTDGRVAVFRMHASSDIADRIQASVTTGYLNRRTDMRKHCQKVRVAMRRGEALAASGPHAWLMYRDRPGAWESRIPIDLGGSTESEVVVEFPSLGVYRRRQWRFEFAGTEDLTLTEVSEEFEVLGD